VKIFGVVGWKNAGKTGLMERLVTEISARGISVSTIKHAHHSFDVDQPGKDSYRHRKAGAREVLLASRQRWALMHEIGDAEEPPLAELLAKMSPVDLVLVEGFKRDTHQKIEVHRSKNKTDLIATNDDTVVAMASDQVHAELSIPSIDLDDTIRIADFVLSKAGLALPLSTGENGAEPALLPNDCFALPAGVDWVPVDQALDGLKSGLKGCVDQETLPIEHLLGRVLAADIVAPRSNPPGANSAVDGYGFSFASIGEGLQMLPLAQGRAAAGDPFEGAVPSGYAVRILTGALIPVGVDTVVLQEDVNIVDGNVSFEGRVKPGANTRKAGEDMLAGDVALKAGHVLRAPELAVMAAIGCTQVRVFNRLRVGVLSTGDEIVMPGSDPSPSKTYDANRPMLLGLAQKWGYHAVDLGHVGDDRAELRSRLDAAVSQVDVILTSGGASAGEEDHMAALLDKAGALNTWRIAMKPGRPLALGLWQGAPIFGLPGNPVAALVCTLIFARPSMSVLAGGAWTVPQGFEVPAEFEKSKKPGRREYLRARINTAGRVEVFASEGSGRISGLSWADGLVELGDGRLQVRRGDSVRYIPYSSFGL
jgi:molybdopterin molybdotransferase